MFGVVPFFGLSARAHAAFLLPELCRMHVLLMSAVCIEPVHRRSPVHRFLLLSLVVFGAAIRSADYVLPSHSDKVHNFVVVVVGLQLFGCNEP